MLEIDSMVDQRCGRFHAHLFCKMSAVYMLMPCRVAKVRYSPRLVGGKVAPSVSPPHGCRQCKKDSCEIWRLALGELGFERPVMAQIVLITAPYFITCPSMGLRVLSWRATPGGTLSLVRFMFA